MELSKAEMALALAGIESTMREQLNIALLNDEESAIVAKILEDKYNGIDTVDDADAFIEDSKAFGLRLLTAIKAK